MRGMVPAHWESRDSTPGSLPFWGCQVGKASAYSSPSVKWTKEKANIVVSK